jgi:hypothetical protein
MRDDGEVSYDGFEYNWVFRQHKWHAEAGKLGGFVRRRRWLRLMMRRAHPVHLHPGTSMAPSSVASSPSLAFAFDRERARTHARNVWKGDVDDWDRCYNLMRSLTRDGLRLEIWRAWLGVASSNSDQHNAARPSAGTENIPISGRGPGERIINASEELTEDRPHAEWIARVVQEHVRPAFLVPVVQPCSLCATSSTRIFLHNSSTQNPA